MKRPREECAICLEELNAKATVTLDCNHSYHGSCICTWLRRNPACPVCRALPDTDESESEAEIELMSMRDLTSLVSDALHASRRKGADPQLRRAAVAFRQARDAAIVARRQGRAHATSEVFRAQASEMRRLMFLEAERRQTAANLASALMAVWDNRPSAPQGASSSRGYSHP